MAENTLLFIHRSQLGWTGLSDILPNREYPALVGDRVGEFYFPSTSRTNALYINDDDSTFNDNFDTGQVLSRAVTLPDGTVAPAGSMVEPQYGYTLVGDDGSVLTIYAVDLRFNNTVGGAYETVDGIVTNAPLVPGVRYTITGAFAIANPPYSSLIPCFAAGTNIKTPDGVVPAEQIRAGMQVQTMDAGSQDVLWASQKVLTAHDLEANPKLRPIRICAGALGEGLPERDLIVSPQHRVLIRSKIAVRMFESAEVLVAAKQLIGLPGVAVAEDIKEVTYVHFLFDQHHIVFAEGAPAESLYLGPEALKAIGEEARAEILTLFPELEDLDSMLDPARPLVKGRRVRKLTERLGRNDKSLLEDLH